MGDRTRGLYRKFTVTRTDGSSAHGGKHDGCNYFVLDVTHDKHADAALLAYAASCEAEYPLLAVDVRDLANQSRSAAALPPSSPVADSPTDLEEADARILHLEAAIQGVLDAYGDDGWARSEMCRRLRRALETSAPSPSAGADPPSEDR